MLRDDFSFANIFALPALAATLVGLHPSNVRSSFLRLLGYALILPEAISNSAVGVQNEKRQRLTLGVDTALYTWTDIDTEAAFGGRFLLGMQFRPHLGLRLPLGDRHGFFASGGYNYDWSWQKTSEWIGWDVQVGIRFGAGDSTR